MNASHAPSDDRPASPDGAGAFAYGTPQAFRAALKAQFKTIANADTRYTVTELQRQFAYDRVLARCFSADDADRWVLKGAGALLARLRQARHSLDIDLYFSGQSAANTEAIMALRHALARDLGDHFHFEVPKIASLADAETGSRVHVRAMLGAKPFATFHVDVVVRTAMAGTPEMVAPLTPLNVAGLIRPPYRAFPLPDHLADKLLAVTSVFEQSGRQNPSSRVKDLVDIALIATSQTVDGTRLRHAIHVGAAHRRRTPPHDSPCPTSARGAPSIRNPRRARRRRSPRSPKPSSLPNGCSIRRSPARRSSVGFLTGGSGQAELDRPTRQIIDSARIAADIAATTRHPTRHRRMTGTERR